MSDSVTRKIAALAHPVRRAMLERLARGSARVGELARPFALTSPAISNHLRVLEEADLIERRVAAQSRIISLRPEELLEVEGWLRALRTSWADSLQPADQDQDDGSADGGPDGSPPPELARIERRLQLLTRLDKLQASPPPQEARSSPHAPDPEPQQAPSPAPRRPVRLDQLAGTATEIDKAFERWSKRK